MQLLPPGDLFQIISVGQVLATGGTNRKVLNSWSYLANQSSGGGNFPGPGIIAAFYATVWNGATKLQDRLSTAYVGQVTNLVGYTGAQIWTSTGAPAPPNGTAGGNREPVSTAVCLTMRTASRGRIYTGRKMLGPIPSADVNGDELNAGIQAVWQLIGNQFLTPLSVPFGGVTWVLTPVIWSQLYTQLLPGATGLVGDILTVVHANRTLSSWRHRRERTVR